MVRFMSCRNCGRRWQSPTDDPLCFQCNKRCGEELPPVLDRTANLVYILLIVAAVAYGLWYEFLSKK